MSTLLVDLDARVQRHWRPPPRLNLSAWADEHFVLPPGDANAGRWQTLPYQRGMMDAITDPGIERVSIMKSSRIGYALALDTLIPTPNGWTTMGAIRVGDQAIDEQGRPCFVTMKSPVYRDHECYRVTFCDGSRIVADAGHRWKVEAHQSLEYLRGERGKGRVGRPKPGQSATHSGVVDTRDLMIMLRSRRDGVTAVAIQNTKALDLPKADLPIPPYTLGLWLGDGNMATPRITQHRPDVETACYIEEEGIKTSVRYIDARYPNNATIFLDVPDTGTPVSPWAKVFRLQGLTGKKHIPSAYLRASFEQRLSLLRGLMDSDGTISDDGRAEFVNTSEALARGVYELVVSLGMKATCRPRPAQRERCKPQHRVNFKACRAVNPFRLRRKADKVRDHERPSISLRRRVAAVEPAASEPVACIAVDSPSHLYLAGCSMIPTHNTKGCVCATVGYYIHHDPANILIVQPTIDDAKKHSKEDLNPMFRDVPVLRALVAEDKAKTKDRTILTISFRGGHLSLVGANSPRGFRRTSQRIILLDEIDGYARGGAGVEGDQYALARRRADTYWNRKIIAGSTPTVTGSRIEELFLEGDQRRYYVPCPSCGDFQVLKFPNLKWPKDRPQDAYFVCDPNGCVIEHRSKRDMVAAGEWRAEAPEHFTEHDRHASFHIWTAYSYSAGATWGQIAAEWVKATHGGPTMLRTAVNTWLGEVWKDRGDAPEWEPLMRRRESYKIMTCPSGVLFLTAGVDVQKDRLVYEVVGWGRGKRSWSIDYGVLPGDTADLTRGPWAQLDALLERTFPHEHGVEMPVRMLAVDSGYNTQQVYAWARRYPMSRVIAIKGQPSGGSLVSAPQAVEVSTRGQRIKRGHKVWPVCGAVAKSELYGWLRLEAPTDGSSPPPGFAHFPEYNEDYFRELTAEHLVTHKTRGGFVKLEWELIPGRQNHALDARCYARAAAAVLGLDRFTESDWTALERSVGQEPAVPAGTIYDDEVP